MISSPVYIPLQCSTTKVNFSLSLLPLAFQFPYFSVVYLWVINLVILLKQCMSIISTEVTNSLKMLHKIFCDWCSMFATWFTMRSEHKPTIFDVLGTCCILVIGPWGVRVKCDSRGIVKNKDGKYEFHHDFYAKYRTLGKTLIVFRGNIVLAHLVVDMVKEKCNGVDFEETVQVFKEAIATMKEEAEKAGRDYIQDYALVSTVPKDDGLYDDIVEFPAKGEVSRGKVVILGGPNLLPAYRDYSHKWENMDSNLIESQMSRLMLQVVQKNQGVGGPIESWAFEGDEAHHSLDLPEHLNENKFCPIGELPAKDLQISGLKYRDTLEEMLGQRVCYLGLRAEDDVIVKGKSEISKYALAGLGK